jgi:hypothetical protein
MTATACSWIAGVSGDVEVVDATDGAQDDGTAEDGAARDSKAPEDVQASDAASEADPNPEAAVEASDVPDGGIAPNPGTVMCAKTACTDKQVCCYTTGQETCQGSVAPNCPGGVLAHCDEASDCDSGQVCCVTAVRQFGLETSCRTSCDANMPQACRTNSECPARNCVPWACAHGTAETCGGAGADAGCMP